MPVDLNNMTFECPQGASLPEFNAPKIPHTNLPNRPYFPAPSPFTLPLPPPATVFAPLPMTAPAPANFLPVAPSSARITHKEQEPQNLEMLHGYEFDKAFKDTETLGLTAVEPSVREDGEIQRPSEADGAAAGHATNMLSLPEGPDTVQREEAGAEKSTATDVDCSRIVASNTRQWDVLDQPITIDSDEEDDGDCQSKTRATSAVGFDEKLSLPIDEDGHARPQPQRRRSGHKIKVEEEEEGENDSGDVEDDEGDEDYDVSEGESEAGDRAPKRQRRVSAYPTENSKEDCSRNSAKSTTSAQNDEGCVSPVSQKDRHGPSELQTDTGSPSLPMNDVLMLASVIASAVVKELTGYPVESGEIVAYNKRARPAAGHPTKGYEERLRDGGSRLRRWSKEEDERLLGMVNKDRPWSINAPSKASCQTFLQSVVVRLNRTPIARSLEVLINYRYHISFPVRTSKNLQNPSNDELSDSAIRVSTSWHQKVLQSSFSFHRHSIPPATYSNFFSKGSSRAVSSVGTGGESWDIEYNWISGVEALEGYQPGGYHPITIGNILHNRYQLARDIRVNQYVAVKVGTAQSCLRETKVLRELSGGTPTSTFQPSSSCSSSFSPSNVKCDLIPTLRDEFELSGPNGVHPCYTTVAAQSNLWETSYSRLFSCEVARAISAALVAAVAYIHTHGYVHGDIHLRNILVKLPTNFDKLSVDEFYKKYGKPETVPIRREDGKPLSSHIPSRAVKPLTLSNKPAWDFTLADARILLSDFRGAFSPAAEPVGTLSKSSLLNA
ncbi:serine/threonine protein kinase [Trichophyton equinum CBS 127.97]|uniref:Serine/threonine protein kinase n=1 Tax=Trichophyton equinum (strain ATCC MYA-4606 / CBS 127.97) TaxID=559882 RepID=F2PQQ6_TRIEC|nr:serine/threonine protein kinase [Trichophyton equinum CBS 127.97]